MPVQFQNPLFNCDHIKEDFFLESKGTKKEGKDYVNKQMYLVSMVTLQLNYSEVFFSIMPLFCEGLVSWLPAHGNIIL